MRYIGTLSTKEVKEMERIFFQQKERSKKKYNEEDEENSYGFITEYTLDTFLIIFFFTC